MTPDVMPACGLVHEDLADQIGGDLERRPRVERAREVTARRRILMRSTARCAASTTILSGPGDPEARPAMRSPPIAPSTSATAARSASSGSCRLGSRSFSTG